MTTKNSSNHADRSAEPIEPLAVFGGEKEDTRDMIGGADDLGAAGLRARFFLLPGVDHGDFGDVLAGNAAGVQGSDRPSSTRGSDRYLGSTNAWNTRMPRSRTSPLPGLKVRSTSIVSSVMSPLPSWAAVIGAV